MKDSERYCGRLAFSYVLKAKKLESVRRILMKAGKFRIEMKCGVMLGWTGKLQ